MEDSSADRQRRILTWIVVVAILLLGFALRVYDLTGTPQGISGDELYYYDDARLVLRGQFPVYFPNNFGHEPMFQYGLAAITRLLGQRAFTARYTAVFGGMLGVTLFGIFLTPVFFYVIDWFAVSNKGLGIRD